EIVAYKLRIELNRHAVVPPMQCPFVQAIVCPGCQEIEARKLDVILRHTLALEIARGSEGAALGRAKLRREQARAGQGANGERYVKAVPQKTNAIIAEDAYEAKVGILLEEC